MKPRIRAVVLDARMQTTLAPLAKALKPIARPDLPTHGHEHDGPLGAILVESPRFEILFEHFTPTSHTTRARVARARGIDLAVVIAGQRNGTASRDLKLLHAAGCRRALLLVPPDVPDLIVENLGRHLLLGARYDADEMPVVLLSREPHAMTADDTAAVLDAVDRCATPFAPGEVLAHVSGSSEHAVIAVLRGALLPDTEVIVHLGPGRAHPTKLRLGRPVLAGSRVTFTGGNNALADAAVLSHAELSFVGELDLAGTFRDDDVPEMCFAFGGAAGFSEGRLHRGRVRLDAPILPLDGHVGLVRFHGASLGPVQSIKAR